MIKLSITVLSVLIVSLSLSGFGFGEPKYISTKYGNLRAGDYQCVLGVVVNYRYGNLYDKHKHTIECTDASTSINFN